MNGFEFWSERSLWSRGRAAVVPPPGKKKRKPDEVEKQLLRLLCEQNAMKLGQLARFFGVYRADMEAFVAEYVELGWVYVERFITGDDVWVWCTGRGDKLADLHFKTRTPHYRSLIHWSAINEARMFVEKGLEEKGQSFEWLCERQLRREQKKGYLPDAAVLVEVVDPDGTVRTERHAIEAELSLKQERELHDKFKVYEGEYDWVTYFAPVYVSRRIAQLRRRKKPGGKEPYPRLLVHEIPLFNRSLNRADWRVPGDPKKKRGRQRASKVQVSAEDLKTLDFIAEEGLVPMDQLARLGRVLTSKAEESVSRLVMLGLVERAKPLVKEPNWVWLTPLGARVCSWDVKGHVPKLGGLEFARAATEIRLHITSSKTAVHWTSGRVLDRDGYRGIAPCGVVEVGGEKHAVDLFLFGSERSRLEERLARRFNEGYDAAVWFYASNAKSSIKRFGEDWGYVGLEVRPLPTSEYLVADQGRGGEVNPQDREPVSTEELWRRLGKEPPVMLYPLVPECVPPTALWAIARAAGIYRAPKVLEAWAQGSALHVVYVLTDVGFYRASISNIGWRADEVERHDVFIKQTGPVLDPRERSWSPENRKPRPEPQELEVSEEVWSEVRPLIPPIEERHPVKGKPPVSDKAVLNGLVWRFRNPDLRWEVPKDRAFGSVSSIEKRLHEWEEMGVWSKVREVLEEKLEDGRKFDWDLQTPPARRARRCFNARQQELLQRMRENPAFTFSLRSYREWHRITDTTANKDIAELADEWMVVGTREGNRGYVFRPAEDLVERMKRLDERAVEDTKGGGGNR